MMYSKLTGREMKVPAALALNLLLATSMSAQQTDFSGTWTRHDAKCHLSEGIALHSIPVKITIIQKRSLIEITRTSRNRQGDATIYTEKLSLDSTMSTAVTIKPNLTKQTALKWSEDHKALQESAQYFDGQGATVLEVKGAWTLQDDGRTLVIKVALDARGKSFEMTEVFDRK